MSRTNPMFRITRPRNVFISRVLGTVVLGGGIIAAASIMWSAPSQGERVTEEIRAVAPIAKAAEPAPVQIEVTEPVSMKEEEVKSQRPLVALAHEDKETDYGALAYKQSANGELGKAFESLRKHIYTHGPSAEHLMEIGRIGRQIGQNAIAQEALMDAGALEPTNQEVQVELARVLLEVGQLEDARVHARQAIRLDADNAIAWNVAGRIAMAQSAWDRAEAALRRAVELDPMNAMFHNNLGLLYVMTKRAEDAIDSLETAVELFDDSAPYFAYNNLGLAHEMAGHLDEAREAFEQALVVNPTYARAKVNLERINGAIAKRDEQKTYETASGPEPKDGPEESLRP